MNIRSLSFLFAAGFSLCSGFADEIPGVTYRLYHTHEPLREILPILEDQTPNLHLVAPTIDFSGIQKNESYNETYATSFIVHVLGELKIDQAGKYAFRLSSDDGSKFWLDGKEIINHDGLHSVDVPLDAEVELKAGWRKLRLEGFQAGGGYALKLEWKPPGAEKWAVVPASHLRTEQATLVTSPGKKQVDVRNASIKPGMGRPLDGLHPDWKLIDISPGDFKPMVGGMDYLPNGDLLVASFYPNNNNTDIQKYDAKTTVYRVKNTLQDDPSKIEVMEVAGKSVEGSFAMSECTGLAVVKGEVYVSLRDNIYRLIDENGDGVFEDKEAVMEESWSWDNFHQFSFCLQPIVIDGEDYLAGTLSVAIYHGGNSAPNRDPRSGCIYRIKIPKKGEKSKADYFAGGFRTPNGVGLTADGKLVVADNQGQWNPGNSIVVVEEGKFYGHYNPEIDDTDKDLGYKGTKGKFEDQPVTPKTIWLPQNTCSNSPTVSVPITEGPFAGQLFLGELTAGGIRRIAFDTVDGHLQGAAFRFTQGFEGGVNRMMRAPDGSIIVGSIGAAGNWSWRGKKHGLQRLIAQDLGKTFEMHSIKAIPGGFEVRFTQPVDVSALQNEGAFELEQFFYKPTPAYGGPQRDQRKLSHKAVSTEDPKLIRIMAEGLKADHIIHFRCKLPSAAGEDLWSGEAWYTMTKLP